jgi:hypothetical protein
MKHLLIATALTLSSAFAVASTFNDDLDLIWLSWCEKENVMQSDANGRPEIRANCAAENKTCKSWQKTNGKRVIYSAMCVEKDNY